MDPLDPERIHELFLRACDLDPDGRGRLLAAECAGDAELRAEIESLLEHDPGHLETTREALATPLRPESIGPYRLLEKLGDGGMGLVYLAERNQPRQQVALKVVKPGMDTDRVLARFESERQALALMNHPNVARIFDAGSTAEGRPYFVMEYVAGIPVTEHCDRHRLGLGERLELFAQICDGIHHAHQKGILHRDLKPSNILVQYQSGKATPKIIDFGVAKALHQPLTDRSFFTERGQLIGTPEYMSPEQAELTGQDIDIRSDVYSLGVLLYELLTGVPPFDREAFRLAGLDGLLRLIRETDPPRPSMRLQTIETTDPDRSSEAARRRRADPRSLVRRLRDDLDWITMMCLEKDRSRRYEGAAALADDVRRHLAQEPVRARPPSATYRALKFWRRHRAALAASLTVLVVLLVGLVAVTALAVSNVRKQSALNDARAGHLVEQARLLGYQYPADASRKLEGAIELSPGSDEAHLEHARLLRRRSRDEEAIAETRALLARNPGHGAAAALLAGLLRRSDPAESERYAKQAEVLLETGELYAALALGEDDDREAIRLFTQSLDENPWNFEALWQRGVRLFRVGELDSALRDAELMVKVRGDLALTWILEGATLLQAGKLEEARVCFERAIERDPGNWIGHYNHGLAYSRMGQPEKALADYDRAIELQPAEPDVHKERGSSLMDLGRYGEAVGAYERVIVLGVDGWEARWDLGAARFGAGDFAGAAADYGAALAGLPDGPDHDGARQRLLRSRTQCHLAVRSYDAARSDLEHAAALGAETAKSESLWGRLYRLQGRYDEAYPFFDRAIALDPGNAVYYLERGVTHWLAGEDDRAVGDLARFAASDHKDVPWVRLWIWEIEMLRGDRAAAARELEQVRAVPEAPVLSVTVRMLRGEESSPTAVEAARTDEDRLHVYYSLGAHALVESRPDEARDWFRRATQLGLTNELEHEIAGWRLARLSR